MKLQSFRTNNKIYIWFPGKVIISMPCGGVKQAIGTALLQHPLQGKFLGQLRPLLVAEMVGCKKAGLYEWAVKRNNDSR
jgi:hypothetical protein